MEKELIGNDVAKKVLDEMTAKFELDKLEAIIKDNKVEFTHKEKKYRVRIMGLSEKEELDELRRKKFSQLMKDKDSIFEKDLIELYKKKGIDIKKLKEEISKLEADRVVLELKLGEALSKKLGDAVLKSYKAEIDKNKYDIRIKIIQQSELLAYSFENTLMNYVAKVITYLSIDILEGTEYIRLFKTMEEFDKCNDEDLIGKATKYALLLQYC